MCVPLWRFIYGDGVVREIEGNYELSVLVFWLRAVLCVCVCVFVCVRVSVCVQCSIECMYTAIINMHEIYIIIKTLFLS